MSMYTNPFFTHYLSGMLENKNIPQVTTSDHIGASTLIKTLVQLGLRDVVISPGSRNAPLTIAVAGNPLLRVHVVIDERAAGYVGLGLALETGKPAIVICTSGTAAVNHGPAIAEAFHQRVPLISITADRPIRFAGAGHGQTTSQQGIFSATTVFSATIDESEVNEIEIENIAVKAWSSAIKGGSVHLNLPFEEPLYGSIKVESGGIIEGDLSKRDENDLRIPKCLVEQGSRAIVIAGPIGIWNHVNIASSKFNGIAGISERYSGLYGDSLINSGDLFQIEKGHEPTAVITVGLPSLSKSLRNQISSLKIPHVHVGMDGYGWDMFGTLQDSVKCDLGLWLKMFSNEVEQDEGFVKGFAELKRNQHRVHESFIKQVEWSDLKAFEAVFKSFNKSGSCDNTLHFANSTSARYALFFDTENHFKVHANRGVAGIDGCTSTAVGHALGKNGEGDVILVSGDIAFLYDINGLASVQELPLNFKVIVVNNGGGGIFKWLEGPEKSGLLDKYFLTKPKTSIKAAARFCGVAYFCAEDYKSTEKGIVDLEKFDGPAILEIKTQPEISAKTYERYLRELRLIREHEQL
ncbi:MAG: 2-succinyl-5-enolpyruvyl-6-hydroxy-3-cyclohexene-1-carboxylic-acid synthase [Bacteroidetes bacterium]|nr:MAG: 2-succinyl-5-enolpyruvyl-6-hydroxy-3-cyclohexene-1-carboxylic-acid synthase [Bacteroidota bacterium]